MLTHLELELDKNDMLYEFSQKTFQENAGTIVQNTWTHEELHVEDDINKHVAHILNANGFTTLDNPEKDDVNVELHRASCTNSLLDPEFDGHEDDYGVVNFKVNTLMIYDNNNTCDGGDFTVFASEDITISTKSSHSDKMKVILLRGDVMHCAEPIKSGIRQCIVFQIRRDDKGENETP